MAVARGPEAYAALLASLLPEGDAWPREPGHALTRLCAWMAAELARVDQRAADLLREADPRRTTELLAEWEAECGLPGECTPADPSLQARRAALLARLAGQGGQSRPYFTALAAALGYDLGPGPSLDLDFVAGGYAVRGRIEIEEFPPFRVDETPIEAPLCDDPWAFVWRVRAPDTLVREFRVDQSTIEDPLAEWGDAVLECEFRRLAPAHTHLLFAYGHDGS